MKIGLEGLEKRKEEKYLEKKMLINKSDYLYDYYHFVFEKNYLQSFIYYYNN
jgi:hypothetical protein